MCDKAAKVKVTIASQLIPGRSSTHYRCQEHAPDVHDPAVTGYAHVGNAYPKSQWTTAERAKRCEY